MQSNVLAGDKARSAASGAFAEAMSTGGTTHPGRVGDSGRHGGRRRGRGRNHRPAGSTQGRDDAPAHRAGRRPRRTRAHLSCTASASVPTHVPTRRVPRLPVAGAGIARAPRPDRTALAEPGQADHCPGRVQEVAGHTRADREFKKNRHNSDDFPGREKSFFCDDVRANTAKRESRDRRVGRGRSATTRLGLVEAALRVALAASAVASMSVCK